MKTINYALGQLVILASFCAGLIVMVVGTVVTTQYVYQLAAGL
ncbi:hypothetical protein [Ectopseudomonas khazarica]